MQEVRDSIEASVLFLVQLAIGLISDAWHVPLMEKTVQGFQMCLLSCLTVGCQLR